MDFSAFAPRGERTGEKVLLTGRGSSAEASRKTQRGNVGEKGPRQGLPSADGLGISRHSEPALGHTLDCAVFLPSPSQTGHLPTTYLWAQPLLWALVCLEVLHFPASLRDPLCQLDQAYLEVPEVLGKRTSMVGDTKSCWKWERRKRGEQ